MPTFDIIFIATMEAKTGRKLIVDIFAKITEQNKP
jgi:hypothetical protein